MLIKQVCRKNLIFATIGILKIILNTIGFKYSPQWLSRFNAKSNES